MTHTHTYAPATEPHAPIPKASILVRAYNAAATISETLSSLLRQTLRDIEIIVVDDASTDNTAAIVSSHADPRIRLIRHQKNCGCAAAMNTAFSAARGTYLVIADADDISHPRRVEIQTDYLNAHPELDGCGSRHVIMTRLPWFDQFKGAWKTWRSSLTDADTVKATALFVSIVYEPTMCIRRSMLDRLEKWNDPLLKTSADCDFYTRALIAGARLVVLPQALMRYRRQKGSNSRKYAAYAKQLRIKQQIALQACLVLMEDISPKEAVLHGRIVMRESDLCVQDLPAIRHWFERRLESNRQKRQFSDTALRRVLADHWLKVCAISAAGAFGQSLSAYRVFAEQLSDTPPSFGKFVYEWQKRRTRTLRNLHASASCREDSGGH